MKSSRVLIAIAALFLIFNLTDILTTWIAISSGRGVEANPLVLLEGGPFSPLSLVLKLLVIPGIVLTGAWLIAHKWKDPNLALAAILPNTIGLAAVTAHNLMVTIAGKKPKPIRRKVVEA